MPFPTAPRVLYRSNPLEEVICQLRFPTILRIDSEAPAAFQEKLRLEYPFYESKGAARVPLSMPPEVEQLLASGISFGGQKAHEFTSRDQNWTINLTRDYIAITCRKYERWEYFRDRLQFGVEALREVYAPSFYTRLGLRYRDIIRRSTVGVNVKTPWTELLQPWIIGPLSSADIVADVEAVQTSSVILIPEVNGAVRIQHGLAIVEASKEQVFLIDADFFIDQQTETDDAFAKLSALNLQGRLFFRWCITDDLHEAMEPTELP